MAKSEDDGFLSRWSRLKEQAREDGPEQPEGVPADEAGKVEKEQPAEEPDEAAIVAALPDIDSLKEGSDFSAFMKKGVPAELRRLALRKLWSVNPLFNIRDGLNDYDLDYSAIGKTAGEVVNTLYQVGKGMPRKTAVPEKAEEQAAAEAEQEAPADQAPADQKADDASRDEQRPDDEAAKDGPEDTQEPAAETPADADAAPGQPAMERSLAEPAAAAADPLSKSSNAAARRWGRFTT